MEFPVVAGRERLKLETVSNRLAREFEHPESNSMIDGLRFSPDGKRLIAGDYPGGVIVVWDVESGQPLRNIETGKGYRGSSDYFHVSPDWKSLYSAHEGPRDYEPIERNGKKLFRWTFGGEVRVWDLTSGQLTRKYQHQPPRFIQSVQHSPDGSKFLTVDWLPGEQEGRVTAATLWNAVTGENRSLFVGKHAYGRFSADSQAVALVEANDRGMTQSLQLMNATDGQRRWMLPVEARNARLAIVDTSPDGRWLVGEQWVYASETKFDEWQCKLKWIDFATGREVDSIDGGQNGEMHSSRFSPDGREFVVANPTGDLTRVDFYDVATRKIKKSTVLGKRETGSRTFVSAPIYSPDAKWIALVRQSWPISQSNDDRDVRDTPQPRIHLIDAATGAVRETMVAPPAWMRSLAFSPDGRWLASGGHGKVQLWDLRGLTHGEPRTK